jgi:hypothetical protein
LTPFTGWSDSGGSGGGGTGGGGGGGGGNRWTDGIGNGKCPKEEVRLPDFNWYWKGEWRYHMDPKTTDSEGWQYATSWSLQLQDWHPQSSGGSFVRRRRWYRLRALKTQEMKEKDNLDHVVSPHEWEMTQFIDDFVEILPTPPNSTNPRKKGTRTQQQQGERRQQQGNRSSSKDSDSSSSEGSITDYVDITL